MHSFQRSRAKILFEVACVLALSASFAAAWQQTGASALLAAGAVAGLYGLVHLFDLRQRRAGEGAAEAVAIQAPGPIADSAQPADAHVSKRPRAKAPRKSAKAASKPKLVAEPVAEPEAFTPVTPIPLAPLFEPEPFVRQQRAFGRKAG